MRILDSDHCIELLGGRLDLTARVRSDAVLGVTSISVGELLHGAQRSAQRERNLGCVEVLLAAVLVLPLDEAAARRFGRIKADLERSGQRLADLDLQIAAICLEAGATLVTHSGHHFARIPILVQEDWLARGGALIALHPLGKRRKVVYTGLTRLSPIPKQFNIAAKPPIVLRDSFRCSASLLLRLSVRSGDCSLGCSQSPMTPTLQVENLRVYYHTARGIVKAVDDVSFNIEAGERFGLIGESGSGKSTIALAIMRLIRPPGKIESGAVLLDGEDLLALSDDEMRRRRLANVAMITQGAMNSLNPVIRIRRQFADGVSSHDGRAGKDEIEERLQGLLRRVGLPPSVASMYPHQLSGGMKQRVCIAYAMSLQPSLIIADEPTSALDVVVQRQVMQTLRLAQQDLDAAVILIGHDMGLMAQFAGRIGVMYAGKLLEEGPVRAIFRQPAHPYTRLLMESLPSLETRETPVATAAAVPPSAAERPSGCVFHPRCPHVMPQCLSTPPVYRKVAPEQWAACHLHETQTLASAGKVEAAP